MGAEAAVFLDVDGVLLDVSRRYYKLHCDIVSEIGGEELDFERFWELKRWRTSPQDLAGFGREAAFEYKRRWTQLVESPAYLELDTWLPQARTALMLLNRSYTVVLVSLRRKSAALRRQLGALSFPRVAQVLSAAPQGDPAQAKARLIQASPHFTRNGVVVGDTEVDIDAGKALGLVTVAVLSGLRAPELLARASPDYAVEGASELPGLLRRLFAGGRP